MSADLVLVTGGARSGKSGFAEKYVLHYGKKCAYIATAEVLDDEMAERVKIHQERRPSDRWNNYEAPYDAWQTIKKAATESDIILFDCLTMYMCNLMYGKTDVGDDFIAKVAFVRKEIDKLIVAARKCGKTVVFVSNEVGCGIVPDNLMAREYRDIAGWVNQQVADAADKVFLCVAGQAVDVKKLAFKFKEED